MDLLTAAILMLENEIAQLQSLTQYPKPAAFPDVYWWALQAKSIGLSHLKSLQLAGIDDPLIADQVRKTYRKELQPASVAEAAALTTSPGASTP